MRKKTTGPATGRRSGSKEKIEIILKLVKEYPKNKVSEWLEAAELLELSYYGRRARLESPIDKDKEIRREVTSIVEESRGKYGYRGVTQVLQNKGLSVDHKRILKVMREESLLCTKFKTRSRKYSSYKGQIGEVANNVVDRQFRTSKPNQL